MDWLYQLAVHRARKASSPAGPIQQEVRAQEGGNNAIGEI